MSVSWELTHPEQVSLPGQGALTRFMFYTHKAKPRPWAISKLEDYIQVTPQGFPGHHPNPSKVSLYIHIFIYIYIHTHTHTHTHLFLNYNKEYFWNPILYVRNQLNFPRPVFFFSKDTKSLLRSVARITLATPTSMGTKKGMRNEWSEMKTKKIIIIN